MGQLVVRSLGYSLETSGKNQIGQNSAGEHFCSPALADFLDNLFHETADLFGGVLLHLLRHVRIDIKGKFCGVVSQHSGNRFRVYAILQSHRGKGPPEIVEPDMLLDSGLFQ